MRISPKQYAQALYEIIKNGDKKHVEKAIKKFALFLQANNNISKLSAIIKKFSEIWNKNRGIVEAEITSAKEIDDDTILLLKDYIFKKIHSSGQQAKNKEIIIKNKIDKNILGGIILRYEDKIVDGSLKNMITEFKNKII